MPRSERWWRSICIVMGCCGLCRSKKGGPIKKSKNITPEKLNTIDTWIENIEGPYDTIDLPSKPADEPKTITNKEERAKTVRNRNVNQTNPFNHRQIIQLDWTRSFMNIRYWRHYFTALIYAPCSTRYGDECEMSLLLSLFRGHRHRWS